MANTKSPPQRVVFRSSEDGQFTTKKEAERAPKTHQREHVPVPAPLKKGPSK